MWRRADRAIWVLGLAYCAFAITFICLFFANVAVVDQDDWMVSAGISLVEDHFIMPAAIGFVITSFAMIFLACEARRYNVQKERFTKTGNIEGVREVLKSNTDKNAIRRALSELPDQTVIRRRGQWSNGRPEDFEIYMSHDAGLVDLGRLQPASAEVRGWRLVVVDGMPSMD